MKNSIFLIRLFWNSFFQKKCFLLHPHENWSNILWYQGWVEILMITLVSSQKPPTAIISAPSVGNLNKKDLEIDLKCANYNFGTLLRGLTQRVQICLVLSD